MRLKRRKNAQSRDGLVQKGAVQVDGALCALGAGAGNSPTELLVATFDRLGIRPA